MSFGDKGNDNQVGRQRVPALRELSGVPAPVKNDRMPVGLFVNRSAVSAFRRIGPPDMRFLRLRDRLEYRSRIARMGRGPCK